MTAGMLALPTSSVPVTTAMHCVRDKGRPAHSIICHLSPFAFPCERGCPTTTAPLPVIMHMTHKMPAPTVFIVPCTRGSCRGSGGSSQCQIHPSLSPLAAQRIFWAFHRDSNCGTHCQLRAQRSHSHTHTLNHLRCHFKLWSARTSYFQNGGWRFG